MNRIEYQANNFKDLFISNFTIYWYYKSYSSAMSLLTLKLE